MTGLPSMLGSMFLMTAILVFGQTSPLPKVASATDASAPCNLGSFPSDVQNHLKSDFGSWKIQEPESLTDHALGRPGLVKSRQHVRESPWGYSRAPRHPPMLFCLSPLITQMLGTGS